jgi:hypothetical protein
MSESALVRAIRLEAPKLGVTIFRNSVGTAWIGQAQRMPNGDVLIKNARRIKFGLTVGSSDLIGWRTRDFVEFAQFVAIECKAKGKRATSPQLAFILAVRKAGGIAGVVYSVEEFRQLIQSS